MNDSSHVATLPPSSWTLVLTFVPARPTHSFRYGSCRPIICMCVRNCAQESKTHVKDACSFTYKTPAGGVSRKPSHAYEGERSLDANHCALFFRGGERAIPFHVPVLPTNSRSCPQNAAARRKCSRGTQVYRNGRNYCRLPPAARPVVCIWEIEVLRTFFFVTSAIAEPAAGNGAARWCTRLVWWCQLLG